MKRRTSIINTAITFIATLGLVFLAVYLCNANYGKQNVLLMVLYYVIGAIIFGFINTLVHEWGHIIAAKKNGFYITTVIVWFFKWTKKNGRFYFDFCKLGEEAGYTESIPTSPENSEKRFRAVSLGGIYASLILTVISVGFIFVGGYVPVALYAVLCMSLPVSAYFLLGVALPAENGGVKNDGAVVCGINKKTDSLKVACSVLSFQGELYQGKTPSLTNEKYLFDVPQLPEDDVNFYALLSARYAYYLDKEDYENAKKVSDRLYGLIDDMPQGMAIQVKLDALYNACTFDFNEDLADNLMYELDKYLNSANTAENLRIKLAYLLYVKKEKELANDFYDKGIKRAEKMAIKGLGELEKKLFDRMKKRFLKDE